MLRGDLADLDAIVGVMTRVAGVDDVSDMSLAERIADLFISFADLVKNVSSDSVFFKEFCGTGSCLDIEPELLETADKRQSIFFIPVCNSYENCTIVLKVHTRCLKSFIKSSV